MSRYIIGIYIYLGGGADTKISGISFFFFGGGGGDGIPDVPGIFFFLGGGGG